MTAGRHNTRGHRLVVSALRLGEAAAIHAVVDGAVPAARVQAEVCSSRGHCNNCTCRNKSSADTQSPGRAHGFIQLVDGVTKVRRPKIDGGETSHGIEGAVEVAQDELAFVAHDSTGDCVQEQGHSELGERAMRTASHDVGGRCGEG